MLFKKPLGRQPPAATTGRDYDSSGAATPASPGGGYDSGSAINEANSGRGDDARVGNLDIAGSDSSVGVGSIKSNAKVGGVNVVETNATKESLAKVGDVSFPIANTPKGHGARVANTGISETSTVKGFEGEVSRVRLTDAGVGSVGKDDSTASDSSVGRSVATNDANFGTPANESVPSPTTTKRVTIVESPSMSPPPRSPAAAAAPLPFNNRNGQPPNLPPSCLKGASSSASAVAAAAALAAATPSAGVAWSSSLAAAAAAAAATPPGSSEKKAKFVGKSNKREMKMKTKAQDDPDIGVNIPPLDSLPAPRVSRAAFTLPGAAFPAPGANARRHPASPPSPPTAPLATSPLDQGSPGTATRSRSVERDLEEFVRSCSVARQSRARSVANPREIGPERSGKDPDDRSLSRLDDLINDVVSTSTVNRKSPSSPRTIEAVNFDLGRAPSPPQRSRAAKEQQKSRSRSVIRDQDLERMQRSVASMSRGPRAFSAGREQSLGREFSVGRDFAGMESTVSKVYVASLEPSDKLCMKVRAAIQREVTMTNKVVDLVWNKIQSLKETNDIMEDIICQTEDELCYCEELTEAVGLDLADILSDAEERNGVLDEEFQLLQELKEEQRLEGGEGGGGEGCVGDGCGGADDKLRRKTSFDTMKKKARKKFTRLKRRESEDIMNSTKCKIS